MLAIIKHCERGDRSSVPRARRDHAGATVAAVPPQLLIVEDDEDSREMLAMLLEAYGFRVAVAARNKLARAEIERTGFDLVIADLMVDSMDPAVSWRNLDELVALARPSPIGLLTSWPVRPEQVREHALAFAVAKPCTSETLLSLVGGALALPPLASAQEHAIRAYFEHIETRDFDALAEACTNDVIYRVPSTGAVILGREAFRVLSVATFEHYRDVKFEIHEIRPLPRGAIARYTGRWRDGDKLLSMTASVLFVLEDLQIAEIGVRLDLARAHELAS
jgi:CheY-like chemotaxis protein